MLNTLTYVCLATFSVAVLAGPSCSYGTTFVDLFAHRTRAELFKLGYFPSVPTPFYSTSIMAPKDPRVRAAPAQLASMPTKLHKSTMPPLSTLCRVDWYALTCVCASFSRRTFARVQAVTVRTYGADILQHVSRNPFRQWWNYSDHVPARHHAVSLGPIVLTSFKPLRITQPPAFADTAEVDGLLDCQSITLSPKCSPGLETRFRSLVWTRWNIEGKWLDFDLGSKLRDVLEDAPMIGNAAWMKLKDPTNHNGIVIKGDNGTNANDSDHVLFGIVRQLQQTLDKGLDGGVVEFGAREGRVSVVMLRMLELYNTPQTLYAFDCWAACVPKKKEPTKLANCTQGQGELLGDIDSGPEKTATDCQSRCHRTRDCVAFDFTTATRSQVDTECRLYDGNAPQLGNIGGHDREYCLMPDQDLLPGASCQCSDPLDT